MRNLSWKIAAVVLLTYAVIGGLLMDVPRLAILNESIRALYYHVPMWFGMVFLVLVSVVYAVFYLRSREVKHDRISAAFAHAGLIYGLLGILTGMVWANYTWGTPWHGDPKQNGAAITTLIYFAYFVLRGSLDNPDQRARLSAVYSAFAFAAMIPLLFVIPRMSSSMHPGSGGNPGFNMYDLDSTMRPVFYPAVIGWILLGTWLATLRIRIQNAEEEILDLDEKTT
jgi:heme exporter protein C